jgi:hypothetical protein
MLHATRVSDGLRPAGTGPRRAQAVRVVGVYRAAVNVVTDHGVLIAIVPEAIGGLPNGILVADAPDLRDIDLRPGMVGQFAVGTLRFDAAGLVVRLDQSRPWSPRLPALTTDPWPARSAFAHRIAAQTRVSGGLADMVTATPALTALSVAIGHVDQVAAAIAAQRLIGLGPGLTPSGDDALTGVAAALHAVSHPAAGFLLGALADVETSTTIVSAAMLRHAASGEAAERIHHLLAGLLAPTPARVEDAIVQTVDWGATSGSDLLLGVLLGLDAATGVAAERMAAA